MAYGLFTSNGLDSYLDSNYTMDIVYGKTKVNFSGSTVGIAHYDPEPSSSKHYGSMYRYGSLRIPKMHPCTATVTAPSVVEGYYHRYLNPQMRLYIGTDTGWAVGYSEHAVTEDADSITLHDVDVFGWNRTGYQANHVSGTLYAVLGGALPSNPKVPDNGIVAYSNQGKVSFSSYYEPLQIRGIVDHHTQPRPETGHVNATVFNSSVYALPSEAEPSKVILFPSVSSLDLLSNHNGNGGKPNCGGSLRLYAFSNGQYGYRPNRAYARIYAGVDYSSHHQLDGSGNKGFYIYGKDYL
ncbi:hypothetical protein L4D00_14925 [Photobacterium swingsii]|uniref:hypothetical protein n=1 Tax=Photobacterium swingsii TaxID=680026 RepID=UPI003D0E8610